MQPRQKIYQHLHRSGKIRMQRLSRTLIVLILVLALSVFAVTSIQAQKYTPPHSRPGPAADTLSFKAFHIDIAPAELTAGKMDLYFASLKTAAARELKSKEGVRVIEAPASSVSLILNPAPAVEGELNPLSIREVRLALQYAINRDLVAQEIYKGMAIPMLTHVSPTDFDYLTIYELVRRSNIKYDPEFAKQVIDRAMTRAGATKEGNIWSFKGKRIDLKFIVRVEDERRDIGENFRVELGKLGFSVIPIYQSFGPAIFTVYGTDPKLFQWHIYTEGWGRGTSERFDYANINQMAAPWLGNMPGWQEVGYWQYMNKTLDEVGQKIFSGQFKSAEERDQLYNLETQMALQESVRIWVATVLNSFPLTSKLEGVTEDAASGPKGIWTLREAYVPGKKDVTVGHLWVWTERTTWNPVGGLGDVYSADIWQQIRDPLTWRHPSTGLPIPFRVKYEVQTAGPQGKLQIPSDAFMWDAAKDAWVKVPSGSAATSKVVYNYENYFKSKWHHLQPMTMADVVYSIYQSFEMTYDSDKSKIEFAIATTSKPYLDTIKAFRILDDNRLEVYLDYWHFETAYIAEYASIGGISTPWEVLAAMDTLVFTERKAAYSDTTAERFQIPWINLVVDRDARLVRTKINDFLRDNFVPEAVFRFGDKVLADKEKAVQRYRATVGWFDKYKILVISNGPYFLSRFDAPAQFAQLEAFRDPTYPFKPGDLYQGRLEKIQITSVGPSQVEIGSANQIKVSASGPGRLAARYVLVEPASNTILQSSEATRAASGEFTIDIAASVSGRLRPGPYQLFVIVYSDQAPTVAERAIFLEAATKTTSTPATTQPPTTTQTTRPAEPSKPSTQTGGIGVEVIYVVVAAAVVIVALAVVLMRRRPGATS